MSFGFHYCPAQISETDLEGEKLVDVDRLWVASSRLEPIRSSLGLSWHQRTFEEKTRKGLKPKVLGLEKSLGFGFE